MILKISTYGEGGYILREKLRGILMNKSDVFKWSDIMVRKFEMLFSFDEYSNPKVKIIVI